METLYDLLGALPRDNAEDLRTAFRRAVKSTHPDMKPGDPDAALKFREIVRANEILGDAEQRAVYDDLLKLASLERKSASGHPVAARIHKIASVMIAFSWAAVATAGGYFLFMYMSAAPVASIVSLETTATSSPKSVHATINGEPMLPPAALPEDSSEAILASNATAASDLTASEARAMPPEGFSAYSSGDLKIRFANLDEVPQPEPKVLPGYADPGIIFYPIGKSEPAFPNISRANPDISRAKASEKTVRAKSAPMIPRKRPLVPTAIAALATPMSLRRTAVQRREAIASAVGIGLH